MGYDTALRAYTAKRIEEIDRAAILVGIPCYYNQGTIEHVIQIMTHGLHNHGFCCRGSYENRLHDSRISSTRVRRGWGTR